MIELYELRQFVAFANAGTLSSAAEILHLSQPALSRNMKKLEENIGVPLFDRKKNKLSLNENGEYVLELAKKLLEDSNALTLKAWDFHRRKRTISLGVCAPAPTWSLAPLISNLYPGMTLQTQTEDGKRLLTGLENSLYHLIVTHRKPESKQYFFKECGRESLMFSLPKGHRYAKRKSLTFAEMDGENMLLMSDIGFWRFVQTEEMPQSNFFVQNDRFSFSELAQASSLPFFTSDLAEKVVRIDGRVNIPIADEKATVVYYLLCKPERKKDFSALFAAL